MAEQSATHNHNVANAIIENIKSSTPRHIAIQTDERQSSVTFPAPDVTVWVVPSPEASFNFACAVAQDIFRNERTFLVVDSEQRRASIWLGKDFGGLSREITDPSEWIELPVVGRWLKLGSLYEGLETFKEPGRP